MHPLEAGSIVELSLTPAPLTEEIAVFLDECWKPARRDGRRSSRTAAC